MKISWQDIPFSPRKCPFFYGWIIVFATTIGILASIPGQTMGVGVFTESISASLGISRLDLTKAYFWGTLTSSLILPFAGRLLDKIGARFMIVISSMGLALSLLIMSQVAKFTSGLTVFFTIAVMSFCFLLIRFFGQGCLTMTSRVTIGKWFNHYRGRAVAISSVLTSFGFNSSPRFLNQILDNFGLEGSYIFMAVCFGGAMAVIGWVFYRDTPEKCGLLMDGGEIVKAGIKDIMSESLKDFSRSEAVKTFSFWVLSMATGSFAMLSTAVVFHMEAIGDEFGATREVSYDVFLPMAIFSVVSSFAGSVLSDKVRFKWIVIAMMLGEFIGLLGLAVFGDNIGRIMMFSGFGIAGGLFATITVVGLPKFFGRKHLGAISGLNMSIMVFSSAVGPYLFSQLKVWAGSFRQVIPFVVLIPVVLLISSMKLKNPQE
ncbi:MAG: MFS transporter [Sedimentisphaeraceae bacterium JB056]